MLYFHSQQASHFLPSHSISSLSDGFDETFLLIHVHSLSLIYVSLFCVRTALLNIMLFVSCWRLFDNVEDLLKFWPCLSLSQNQGANIFREKRISENSKSKNAVLRNEGKKSFAGSKWEWEKTRIFETKTIRRERDRQFLASVSMSAHITQLNNQCWCIQRVVITLRVLSFDYYFNLSRSALSQLALLRWSVSRDLKCNKCVEKTSMRYTHFFAIS